MSEFGVKWLRSASGRFSRRHSTATEPIGRIFRQKRRDGHQRVALGNNAEQPVRGASDCPHRFSHKVSFRRLSPRASKRREAERGRG